MLHDLGVHSHPVINREDYEKMRKKHKQLHKQRTRTDREQRMLDFLDAYFKQFEEDVAATTLYLQNAAVLDARIAHVERLIRKGDTSYSRELRSLTEKKDRLQQQTKKLRWERWMKAGAGAALLASTALLLYKTNAIPRLARRLLPSPEAGLTWLTSLDDGLEQLLRERRIWKTYTTATMRRWMMR